MRKLHEEYGDVVRVAPEQVAFTDARAWKELMGHRRPGQLENIRDPIHYSLSKQGLIGSISSEEHGRQRRIVSHGFSSQAMMEQQPLIQQYVDLLMQRLRENCQGGTKALDMTKWYNWTTFVSIPLWKPLGDSQMSLVCAASLRRKRLHQCVLITWHRIKHERDPQLPRSFSRSGQG